MTFEGILATNFFTVETVFLLTLYVLFFIEIGSRKLRFLSSTRNPDTAFVTQQARNLSFELQDRDRPLRFLIRDHDSKYTGSFDEVFRSEGAEVILTPIRSPKANSFAERSVRTVRHEVLDLTLVLGQRHLDRLLAAYECHYNSQRPHRGLDLNASTASSAARSIRLRGHRPSVLGLELSAPPLLGRRSWGARPLPHQLQGRVCPTRSRARRFASHLLDR